jgi:hypothetical protein
MQLHHSLLILATLVVTCVGEDGATKMPPLAPAPGAAARPNAAWLGCSVRKPDPAGAAQIPSLPPGVGFVIQAVTPGGPAALAQLQPMDVLWKFGDQLLVNQGQLATLLGLGKPGEEVMLAIFRAGKPVAIKITLGEAPADTSGFSREMIDAAILPDGEEMPRTRIVTMLDRTATYTNSDGKALVRRDGEGYKVVISGPDTKVIFDGTLGADGNLESIPADWRRRICVLRRSLDHALESRIVPVRAPRPRVVPPPPPAAGGAPPLSKH